LSEGIQQFGGLQVTPDGSVIYAGVTFDDKSKGIVKAFTAAGKENQWTLVAKTTHQPNGMAADWTEGVLYCTDEGTGDKEGGTVFAVNITDGTSKVAMSGVSGADGCWLDVENSLLYVGELLTMKIWVYNVKTKSVVGQYPGASSATSSGLHMLDDITLHSSGTNADDIGKTLLYGADFTGKQIVQFSLDGSFVERVSLSSELDLYEPTSVRYGKGPGFDSESLYITEGGGATKKQTQRRALQLY
jgi:hypothetical protein